MEPSTNSIESSFVVGMIILFSMPSKLLEMEEGEDCKLTVSSLSESDSWTVSSEITISGCKKLSRIAYDEEEVDDDGLVIDFDVDVDFSCDFVCCFDKILK